MDTKKLSAIDLKMVAHRGLSGLERENSMAAFIAANNRSYFGTECDIHLTKDNHFVICHDANTARVANQGLEIKESTLEEIKALRLKDLKDNEPKDYLLIPTLTEYLSCAKHYNKYCVIEIKCELDSSGVDKLLAEVSEYKEHVIFISFILNNLKLVREKDKEVKMQWLLSSYNDEVIPTCKEYNLDVDIHFKALTIDNTQAMINENIEINVWTVDNPLDALTLAEWGVKYITTNILE